MTASPRASTDDSDYDPDLSQLGSSNGEGNRGRPLRTGPARGRNAELTRSEIVIAAARHFAKRGYAHVHLQDIAADADVTPALIIRYFGSKRALFGVVATSEFAFEDVDLPDSAAELAHGMVTYWRDAQARTPAVALLRSMDLDDGALFYSELKRRVLDPWRTRLLGHADAEAKVRLIASLNMGIGLFGIGALFGDSFDDLSEVELKAMERRLVAIIEACLAD